MAISILTIAYFLCAGQRGVDIRIPTPSSGECYKRLRKPPTKKSFPVSILPSPFVALGSRPMCSYSTSIFCVLLFFFSFLLMMPTPNLGRWFCIIVILLHTHTSLLSKRFTIGMTFTSQLPAESSDDAR